jgi:hypothetical protein
VDVRKFYDGFHFVIIVILFLILVLVFDQ